MAAGTGLLSTGLVGLAAVSQLSSSRVAHGIWWASSLALWLILGAAATGGIRLDWAHATWIAAGFVGATAVFAVMFARRADQALASSYRRVLAITQRLFTSLSGALAALDLGLLFDVLLDRRWNSAARVISRPGRWRGAAALWHRDLVRLRRSPQPALVLAGSLLVPYAVGAAGAGRLTPVVAALVGFVAAVPLLAGLRVLSRGPSLIRMLPFSGRAALTEHVINPGLLLICFAAAAAPSWLDSWTPAQGWALAAAVALSALSAATRWVTSPAPDYAKPMVSTPAGAVPTGLFSSLLRGFDVWLLTALPLLLLNGWWGPCVSVSLSLVVLAVVVDV